MIGFVIGTLCLIGLMRVVRGGRCGARGWGGGCGSRGFGGHGDWHRGHHGRHGGPPWMRGEDRDDEGGPPWARSGMLNMLFRRLDTSPGQEKVIREAADELRKTGKQIREDGRKAREQVAKSFRSDSMDEVALGEAIHQVDGAVEAARKAAIDALAKVHAALDERQRSILADLIERGPFGRGGRGRDDHDDGHPYRQAF